LGPPVHVRSTTNPSGVVNRNVRAYGKAFAVRQSRVRRLRAIQKALSGAALLHAGRQRPWREPATVFEHEARLPALERQGEPGCLIEPFAKGHRSSSCPCSGARRRRVNADHASETKAAGSISVHFYSVEAHSQTQYHPVRRCTLDSEPSSLE
jgi:hypothetical protein